MCEMSVRVEGMCGLKM